MKTINILFTFLLIIGTGSLTSCSKETKIEKNLWKKGGEWNIERLDVKQVSTDPADNYEETLYNYGSYKFNEDGSGILTITVDGGVEVETFNYSNTENELVIVYFNGVAQAFDLDWKKNEMTISGVDYFTSNNNQITYYETYVLKKK